MRRESDSGDPRASQRSFRHSFSFSSILRGSSRSPDRTRKIFVGSQNNSKASFSSVGSLAIRKADPVRPEEFADSDTSQEQNYSDEEVRAAESIYSVIQEYEQQRHSFLFNEEFDVSDESHESANTTARFPVGSPNQPFSIPEEEGRVHGQHIGAQAPPTFETAPLDFQNVLPHVAEKPPNVVDNEVTNTPSGSEYSSHSNHSYAKRSSKGLSLLGNSSGDQEDAKHLKNANTSLSSGELLTRLDPSMLESPESSNRNSVNSELALQTLISGVDLGAEFPVMVYSVHDRSHSSNRWSMHDRQQGKNVFHASRHPPAIPIQIRDGTSLARWVSLQTSSHSGSSRNRSFHSAGTPENTSSDLSGSHVRPTSNRYSSHRSRSSSLLIANSSSSSGSPAVDVGGTNFSTPGVFSNLREVILEDEPGYTVVADSDPLKFATRFEESHPRLNNSRDIPTGTETETQTHPIRPRPYLESPAASFTQDSLEKKQAHVNMVMEVNWGFEKYAQSPRPLYMPWSKWVLMMLAALLAVPIFFLLPFGAFDYGGLDKAEEEERSAGAPPLSANWRFRRRYTRVQKIASFVLGVVWIAIVLAMIAVGFAVGLKR